MELEEIRSIVAKLERAGLGRCESCGTTSLLSELNDYSGTFLCPACIEKASTSSEKTIELPA